MTTMRHYLAALLACCALALCSMSCLNPGPLEPTTGFPPQGQFPKSFVLHLTPEYLGFGYALDLGSSQWWQHPIGPALRASTTKLAESLGVRYEVSDGAEPPACMADQVLITPSISQLRADVGLPSSSVEMILLFDWTITSPDGRELWNVTAEGFSRGPLGSSMSMGGNMQDYLQFAIGQAMKKSRERLVADDLRQALSR